jgi:hypothetical protein
VTMDTSDTVRLSAIPKRAVLGLSMVIFVGTGWSQAGNTSSQQPVPAMVGLNNSATPAEAYTPDTRDDRMMTPPPVSGQTYPIVVTSEERTNYLRGGLSFTGAYTDNALGAESGRPISDVSYSVAPVFALDKTMPRLHYLLIYAPGFTFYQRISSRNEADQNVSIEFEYRLSPHLTFSARDGFQKSSNAFNQPPDFSSLGVVTAGAQSANFSVIAPIADRLSNTGDVGLTYQFARNDMIGGSGTFINLHYPNRAEVPGIYDSSAQAGLVFYSHRVAMGQDIGVTYEFQRLLSYPTFGVNETQTHATLFFYTFAPTSSHFSLSLFGGPQHSDTVQPPALSIQPRTSQLLSWTPAAGASLGWQGRLNSFALAYTHIISGGGGLIGAVQLDSATASVRQQITKTLGATVSGGYAQNDVLGTSMLGITSGHSISGTASLQQLIGPHLMAQLGYTRLHQNYSNVEVISVTPDTNREFVSISYQFSKPLGR